MLLTHTDFAGKNDIIILTLLTIVCRWLLANTRLNISAANFVINSKIIVHYWYYDIKTKTIQTFISGSQFDVEYQQYHASYKKNSSNHCEHDDYHQQRIRLVVSVLVYKHDNNIHTREWDFNELHFYCWPVGLVKILIKQYILQWPFSFIQGHRRSLISACLLNEKWVYNFLLVINNNFCSIMHRLRKSQFSP